MRKTIFAVTALLVVAFLRMRSEASLRLIRQADQDTQQDLCFPMKTGRQWGGLDTIWQVVGFGPSEFSDPTYPESFHITGRLGSGGATDVWLAKGVGIVGVRYLHQGTCDEYVKKLWAFQRN